MAEQENNLAAVMRLHEEVDALLDDPDQAGAPEDFLIKLFKLLDTAASKAQAATIADFNAEYTEDDDDQEGDTNGHGSETAESVLSAGDIF